MIIACPSCKRRYVLKKNAIPESGQTVRCMACGNEWLQNPIDTMAASEKSELEKIQPSNNNNSNFDTNETLNKGKKHSHQDTMNEKFKNNRDHNYTQNTGRNYGLITLLLSIAFIVSFFYFKSDYIMNNWPSTSAIYKVVGITKNINTPSTLEIKIKKMTLKRSLNKLNIEGLIVNTSEKAIPMGKIFVDGYGKCHNIKLWNKPFTRSRIHNKKGKQCVIKTWDHRLKQRILGKEKSPFDIKINDIPNGVDSIVVRF